MTDSSLFASPVLTPPASGHVPAFLWGPPSPSQFMGFNEADPPVGAQGRRVTQLANQVPPSSLSDQ